MTDRERILQSLPQGIERPVVIPHLLRDVTSSARDLFEERFLELGGEIVALDQLLSLEGPFYLDSTVPSHIATRLETTDDVWRAQVGLSMADCGVAETGSLLFAAHSGASRLLSLLPPVHAVVVRVESLVPGLESLMTRIPVQNSALVTGPSRTADIEGVLVRGIHGPKRVVLAYLP